MLAAFVIINTQWGQNWIGRQVTKRFSRELQTKITIQKVRFTLLNRMSLEGVLIEDRDGDTLMFAGRVNVRITDWFIFKKQAELKYVGLEDAIIKFQRSDSIWRQQFIFDYFTSPRTDTAKKKAGIVFNLKKLEMKNVTFLKKDGWLGQDMRVHVNGLNMDANALSLAGNHYDINSLVLDAPDFSIYNYPGNRPAKLTSSVTEAAVEELTDALLWNREGMELRIANLRIRNGSFASSRKLDRAPYSWFDGQNIYFSQINAELTGAGFVGDTIYSRLQLSAKERSGLEVKTLASNVKFKPTGMEFHDLDLQTNRSRIRDFFSMSYNDMSEMSDFIHRVKMAAVFNDSYIDSDDIAFFSPRMEDWNKHISLNGKVRGTVSDLVGTDMFVQAGNSTLLNGDLSLTGLPNINETFIDLRAKELRTNYQDAVTLIPAIRQVTTPDLRKIHQLSFQGNFTGFIRDFVTYGTIQTNLGTVVTDINMKLPQGQQPVYSGTIETDNFRIGELLSQSKLGTVSMTGIIKGTGFNARSRKMSFDGTVRHIDYNDYRYSNIAVSGILDRNLFEGTASIHDENAELDLNGIIDFNGREPRFDLIADVAKLNLRPLKLSADDYSFRGKLDLDFTSGSIDNFLGEARISEAEITRAGSRLPFDSLVVRSVYTDSGKLLFASSNEFNAKILGDFTLSELPAAFSVILHRYYPSYITAPARFPRRNQKISFDITTYYAGEFLRLIDTSFSGFNNSHIEGRMDLAANNLYLKAQVPQFNYRRFNFDDVNLEATGDASRLLVKGKVHNVMLAGNDSVKIPVADFTINARNDSSFVNLVTEANRNLDTANLNALVLTYNDGMRIEFDRSTFTLNGKTWTIDENGELAFRRRTPVSGRLLLTEGEQKIVVNTAPSAKGGNDIHVQLQNLNIGDLSPLFLPKNRLEGLVSGNVRIEDATHDMRIVSDDIQTRFLRIDNDSLGEVKASLLYEKATGKLTAKGNTLNQDNYLAFDVNVFPGDPARAIENHIALVARNYHIGVLERFLGTLFSDMQGYLTGNVDLTGPFTGLTVTGKGRLRDAGLKVNFTQVFYDIQDTDIELKSTEIKLDGLVLIDTITGNPVYITGGIEHESFRNMFYNIDISTRKPGTTADVFNRPIQLLNTSYRNNKQFFGNVKGTGSLSLLGPQSNMFMKIDAIASTEDSSYVTIPPVSSRVSGSTADFLVERKYGREMTTVDYRNNATNIIYDVDVTANPLVNVKVVLDELTGDEIKGRGEGTLNIRSGTSDPLTLRGRFDIQQGSYLFTFQSFFKKPFELRAGASNYIEWNGDPNDAHINFEAMYKADRVSYAPLVNSLQLSNNLASARGDVFVVAHLTDQLFKPTIRFGLEFPETSPAVSDPELALIVQQMQKNSNELTTQVAYLVVFNSFAPVELGAGDSNTGLGINTISSILLNVISDQINKLFGNLLKSDKYDIRLNTSLYRRNLIDETGTGLGSNFNLTIARSFFNNRFIISTGVGLDAPLQQTNFQQGLQFLPDVSMQWLINPSGSIRAIFFYRENADYLTSVASGPGKARKVGGSLAYRKDFNRLGDLFRKKQKKVPPPPVDQPLAPKSGTEPVKEED